jgi:tRNA pseudouridine65 synthase
MDMLLEILYQDEHLVAINKPPDLLVHRTKIAKDVKEFALQILRDQLEKHVFPIHRLDRKTSGVLLFALNEEILKVMHRSFAEKKVHKKYLAIVRGFTGDEGTINYSLRKENGVMQEAITNYKTLAKTEINVALGKHPTSRYSLLEIQPETGRKHQIRKHMAHILHPIIADRPHGCNRQNKLFKEKFGLMTMMLHAHSVEFIHPADGKQITLTADVNAEFKRMIKTLGFQLIPGPAFG